MPTLFSYVVVTDSGLAPHPRAGLCSLAVCKPAIRRAASVGDWVVGVTSSAARAHPGSAARVIFAMCVTEKISFEEYDRRHPERRPQHDPRDPWRWRGDSIYDFSSTVPTTRHAPLHQRPADRDHDLSCRHVLLSTAFTYFGRDPAPLPPTLAEVARVRRGHRSRLNDPFAAAFTGWIRGLDVERNVAMAEPRTPPRVGCTTEAFVPVGSLARRRGR